MTQMMALPYYNVATVPVIRASDLSCFRRSRGRRHVLAAQGNFFECSKNFMVFLVIICLSVSTAATRTVPDDNLALVRGRLFIRGCLGVAGTANLSDASASGGVPRSYLRRAAGYGF